MRQLNSFAELEEHIKQELRKQPETKTVEIKLDTAWFFKLGKLIQFYLKHDKTELDAHREIKESTLFYRVKINNRKVKVLKYDL